MTGVETIGRIRFEHFQNGKGIKRIARELGIARDTVRKVLRSGATEFVYKREVQPQRRLGAWIETLTAILEAEDKLPRRERRSTVRLFEELRGRGYDGAHDSVHRFVKSWRTERARAPMHAFASKNAGPVGCPIIAMAQPQASQFRSSDASQCQALIDAHLVRVAVLRDRTRGRLSRRPKGPKRDRNVVDPLDQTGIAGAKGPSRTPAP